VTERQLANFCVRPRKKNPEIHERFRTTAQGPSDSHLSGIASQEQPSRIVNPYSRSLQMQV
jgi:hypothetical protein